MNTKHVYFVRHGESVTNATRVHHGPFAKLTLRGQEQAKVVAKRLSALPVTRVIASPYERTVHTATPIAEAFGVLLEHTDLIVERRGPSQAHMKHGDDPAVRAIWETIGKNYHKKGWKYSDEENFEEMLARADATLDLLRSFPDTHIVAVSHALFIKMVMARVVLGELLNGRIFWDHMMPIKNLENTGIMHLSLSSENNAWKLMSWNDHVHIDDPTLWAGKECAKVHKEHIIRQEITL